MQWSAIMHLSRIKDFKDSTKAKIWLIHKILKTRTSITKCFNLSANSSHNNNPRLLYSNKTNRISSKSLNGNNQSNNHNYSSSNSSNRFSHNNNPT